MPNRREVLYTLGAFMFTASAGCSRPETKNPPLSSAEKEKTAAADRLRAGLPAQPISVPTTAPAPKVITTVPASPESLPTQSEKFTVPELQKLGYELAEWRLRNGQLASEAFKEIKNATNVLKGNVDPRIYNPFIKPPIKFSTDTGLSPDTDNGRFLYGHRFGERTNDGRQILIKQKNKGIFLPWLSMNNSEAILSLSPNVLTSSLRFPIVHKEIFILVDTLDVRRLYIQRAEQHNSLSHELINPNNIPTDPSEITHQYAVYLNYLEDLAAPHKRTLLFELSDTAPAIRAAISFLNWQYDQEQKGALFIEDSWQGRYMQLMKTIYNRRATLLL